MLLVLLLAIIVVAFVGWVVFGLVFKLIGWALVGLVIGALARLVLPGRQRIGVAWTVLDGIGGALAGGVTARAAHLGSVLQFVVAVGVATALVALSAAREQRLAR